MWSQDLGSDPLRKDDADETAEEISVKDRLVAWWNGDVLPERPVSKSGKDGRRAGASGEDADELDDTPRESAWSETRRQLAQEIWSHGFIVPGGTDYIEKLVNGCSLTAAETLLEIGVGMGGGARTIIGKFGNYVTGYERDENLAAAARRHAVTYDIDDKLDVEVLPFEKLRLKSKYFRAALVRDVLYTVKDKAALISAVGSSLKKGDSFLILTDFLFDADDESDELAAWKEVEELPVYPFTKAELVKTLERAGIRPRIVDDESEDYCAMVIDAWSEFMATLNGPDVSPAMARELEREGEYWARRVAALKAGVLRYYRIEAVKTS